MAGVHGAHEPASTEPHSWECGESTASCATTAPSGCFNGAALVGVRRDHRHILGPWLDAHASTEPHSWECGEWPTRCVVPTQIWRFNGAALVGVRRACLPRLPLVTSFPASTEPHSWECGEVLLVDGGRTRPGASTEPHSWECGENLPITRPSAVSVTLQRSRTRGSAESQINGKGKVFAEEVLQRSRTRGSAERNLLPLQRDIRFRLQRSRTRGSAES